MNKTIKTVALLTTMSIITVGCQKEVVENIAETTAITQQCSSWMYYEIDGVACRFDVENEEDVNAMLSHLIGLATEGHHITIRNGEVDAGLHSTKERVVFSTKDEVEAKVWSSKMIEGGYTVSIVYNTSTGIYECVAVK